MQKVRSAVGLGMSSIEPVSVVLVKPVMNSKASRAGPSHLTLGIAYNESVMSSAFRLAHATFSGRKTKQRPSSVHNHSNVGD